MKAADLVGWAAFLCLLRARLKIYKDKIFREPFSPLIHLIYVNRKTV